MLPTPEDDTSPPVPKRAAMTLTISSARTDLCTSKV
jgi:hypothetical protein